MLVDDPTLVALLAHTGKKKRNKKKKSDCIPNTRWTWKACWQHVAAGKSGGCVRQSWGNCFLPQFDLMFGVNFIQRCRQEVLLCNFYREKNGFWNSKNPLNWLTDRPTNLPTNQPTDKPTYQPTNQLTNQITYQPTNLPTNRPTDRSTNRPNPSRLLPGRKKGVAKKISWFCICLVLLFLWLTG